MIFSKPVKAVTDGIKMAFLRGLCRTNLELDQLGEWAERLGNVVQADGLIINMDNPLLPVAFKGSIMVSAYENYERQMIQHNLPYDEPVIELGASIGVIACLVNRKLLSPDQHVVVEANPEVIPTLKKNRDLNKCQFEIVEAAVAYGGDSITFVSNGISLLGSIYHEAGKKMEVPARTLQSIAEKAGFRYFNVICDIEGSEIEMIEHEIDFIREHVGMIIMEAHYFTPYSDDGVNGMVEKLQTNGFEIIASQGKHYCFRNKALMGMKKP